LKKFVGVVLVWSVVLAGWGAAYRVLLYEGGAPIPTDPTRAPTPTEPTGGSKLTDWGGLQRVEVEVPPIKFSRNQVRLPDDAEPILKELAENLKSRWSRFYLRIEGNTSSQGDPSANRKLAEERALVVRNFLIDEHVPEDRIEAGVAKEPGQGSEVQFVVLQKKK
jgi:outer membrane protein OmpA-like peptidoglycan-associated protein